MTTSSSNEAPPNCARHVAVIGGGLVGSLQACFLAEKGFEVELFEAKEDIRTRKYASGRSINLGLSHRGREALKLVGLEDEVIRNGAVPMHGRMIHSLSGKTSAQAYGKKGQNVLSMDRRRLNETLLTAAESYPNVKTHFRHKLVQAELDKGTIVILDRNTDREFTLRPDLIVGCDGVNSAMRAALFEYGLINYSQEYLTHGYMELHIPAKDGKFAMEANYLHVWPREPFTMIATPNPDGTFNCALFLPLEEFADIKIRGRQVCLEFFREHFPDAVTLIGEQELTESFIANRACKLMSIKCSPYHYKDKAVIIGDAAHAMVPFYGQGMNCGFEDCIVFSEALDKFDGDLAKVLPAFSEYRSPDAQAMCDLNLYNFKEMRSLVNSRWFLFRKYLDWFLQWLFPKRHIPLYTMVTFSRIRYGEVVRRWKRQTKIVNWTLFGMACLSVVVTGIFIRRFVNLE
ncbi:kynurenine 3-monooxygenase-like [Patiria miniata]|uniref:Kynurenine 3-monooxygenase n=1 Tax=Patiria miniata TaxID=46514 RepID=A0A914BFB5_PATMI|nr:kynurenine 3-monooxygenase-like [Patiria miniata]